MSQIPPNIKFPRKYNRYLQNLKYFLGKFTKKENFTPNSQIILKITKWEDEPQIPRWGSPKIIFFPQEPTKIQDYQIPMSKFFQEKGRDSQNFQEFATIWETKTNWES